MAWAEFYIRQLKAGKTVQFKPKGNSMAGKIDNGDLVTLVPSEGAVIQKGDIVLCKVKGNYYLHLISAIKVDGAANKFQISNNKGHVNGWISRSGIFGKVIRIEKSK